MAMYEMNGRLYSIEYLENEFNRNEIALVNFMDEGLKETHVYFKRDLVDPIDKRHFKGMPYGWVWYSEPLDFTDVLKYLKCVDAPTPTIKKNRFLRLFDTLKWR